MTHIEFVLHGKVDGQEITPCTIDLPRFNDFNQQVETFIGGGQKVNLDQVHVEVAQGSYILRARLPTAVLALLQPDLTLLARQDVLGELDTRRAEVLQKWQARAKSDPDLSYEVRPEDNTLPKVRVDRETDFRVGAIVPWVKVEKYLLGQIIDMGGAQKVNVHLKLDRGGKTVFVGASQDYLREQQKNLLYHKALLHVSAEQHYRTGELRNVQLISFEDYQPVYSADAIERFTAAGAVAWADVPDAAQWVREARGQ
jgi:hypothetical protein